MSHSRTGDIGRRTTAIWHLFLSLIDLTLERSRMRLQAKPRLRLAGSLP